VIIELARLTSENKGSGVKMWMLEGANQVVFRIGKTTLVSRVLEGNFPDVDKIIPIDFKTKVQVNREDLVKAVKAVSIFARENANIVRFKIQEDKILVFTMGSQTGEAEVEIEAECEGDAMEVAFNYKYVLDYLQAVDEENVDLALSGATTAAVWGGQDLLHLIMPIRG
jgi:DNA polymerase-3 subunit beta